MSWLDDKYILAKQMQDHGEFVREMQNEFRDPDPDLTEIAWEYHRRAENYDRKVCSGVREGIAIPTNPAQFRLVNDHARRLLDELVQRENRGDTLEYRRRLHDRINSLAGEFEKWLRATAS